MILTVLFVFMASLVADIVWVFWVRRVTQLRPGSAAFWAAMILLIGSPSIHYIGTSLWYALPAGAGAAVGAWGTTEFEKKKETR